MEHHIDAAVKWLYESEITNKNRQLKSFGGINNGYLWKEKKYQYVYNEITGYAINSFIAMYKWLGEEKYLQSAKDAADYLICFQSKNSNKYEYGGISHSLQFPELNNIKNYYSFDNAVILHGMANLYNITKEDRFYEACYDIAKFLLKMQKNDGSFYSFYEADKKAIEHAHDEFWFDNGCLHVKNAIGLLWFAYVTGEQTYRKAALNICDWGMRLLDKDGLFWANNRKRYVFTHAHCYATEGYLYAYFFSEDPKYLEIAQEAGEALIKIQNDDGSLYRIYKNKISMKNQYANGPRMSVKRWHREKKYPWKTIDATSQAARIWTLLYAIDNDKTYLAAAEKAVRFLAKHQVLKHNDKNMLGGLYYQLCDTFNDGDVKLNGGMYTWCTQFSLSAFMLMVSAKQEKSFEDMIDMLF
jgi:uncharacterized protein YyaL (SSP411 family)